VIAGEHEVRGPCSSWQDVQDQITPPAAAREALARDSPTVTAAQESGPSATTPALVTHFWNSIRQKLGEAVLAFEAKGENEYRISAARDGRELRLVFERTRRGRRWSYCVELIEDGERVDVDDIMDAIRRMLSQERGHRRTDGAAGVSGPQSRINPAVERKQTTVIRV
jgi:hypothetical protein